MINEQDEGRCEPEENTNHDELLINLNSSSDSLPKDFTALTTRETDSDSKNESDSKEIREIVQEIANAVFCETVTGVGQSGNRSSNSLGMRVKDSLILKVQQTQKKENPFEEIKASLACRLIADDDLQIRFLPRIESLPLSSDGENLSTKQKKSVSLAEEVKVFDGVENEFFTENGVDFFNELMDTRNDGIMDNQGTLKNENGIYDLTSLKTSSSPAISKTCFSRELDAIGSTEGSAFLNQDQEMQMPETVGHDLEKSKSPASSKDAEKFDDSEESTVISSNIDPILDENVNTEISDYSAYGGALGVRNLSIAPYRNESKMIGSSKDTTSSMNEKFIFKNEITKEEETIEDSEDMSKNHSKDRFENIRTKLIDRGKELTGDQSKITNEDRNKSALHDEDRTQQGHPNDSGISEENEPPESLSRNNRVDKDRPPADENVKSFKTDSDVDSYKFFEKTFFATDSGSKNELKLPVTSLVQERPSENENLTDITVIAKTKIDEIGNKTQTNHEEELIDKTNFDYSHSINPDVIGVDKDQNPERRFSSPDKLPNSSSEGLGVDDEAITVEEEERCKPSPIYDHRLLEFPHLNLRGSFGINVEDTGDISSTCKESETDKVERKYSEALSEIESRQLRELRLSDEKLIRKSMFDEKTSNSRSSSSSKRTSSKVSLNGNLSKKSSGTDDGPDQPSTNDPSPEKTSSKVSRKASNSSGKLSRTDISGITIPGSNNLRLTVETSLLFLEDRNVPNQSEIDHYTTENRSSDSFLNSEACRHRNKSEDLSTASVSSNIEQSQHALEPPVNSKKRNGFMKGSKGSSQSRRNHTERSKEKNEQVDSEFSTTLEDGNNIDLLSSLEMIEGDCLISRTQKSKIELSEELNKETPRNMVESYSVEDHPSTCGVSDLSSTFDHSQNLSERRSYNVDERDTKVIRRELELISKSSEDLKSKPLQTQDSRKISESDSTSETGKKTTIQKSGPVFVDKPDFAVAAYLQTQSKEKNTMDGNEPSDPTLIKNETIEEQSNDLKRQDKERHSLLSSIKSVFKSPSRSEPQQRLVASNENLENSDVIKKSLDSLRTNKLGALASKIKTDREESVHTTKESVQIPVIRSMKSLQDNRERSKNRRRTGHKLLDGEDTSLVAENLAGKSCQASTQSDFIKKQNEEKTEDLRVDNKSDSSEESVTESSQQTSRTVEEDQTVKEPSWGKKFKKKESPEGSRKRFVISLSRIFSDSSRKRSMVVNSVKATSNEQTNPEDHFEITKIPLSSSDDSDTQGNDCKKTKQKPDTIEDNGEEIVAIKSLDPMHDSDNRIANGESIGRGSLRPVEPNRAINTSNEQILLAKQSGTFIYSASIIVNQISSGNELAKTDSLDDVQETRKPAEKIGVAKGTIVSYAPMVESAKYIPEELDDQSVESNRSKNRFKISSGKALVPTIRKLFSRASIRNRSDHANVQDRSIDHTNHELKRESKKPGKSDTVKHRKDEKRSMDYLDKESKRESVMPAEVGTEKSTNDDEDVRNYKCDIDYRAHGSKHTVKKSDGVYIAENEVNPNHGDLKSTEIVGHTLPLNQTDLNDVIAAEQKLNQRSNHSKKSSLLSMAKSYIEGYAEIKRIDKDGAKIRANKKKHDSVSVTLPIENSKKTLREEGISKTESVLSRGLKRLFKKRNSTEDSVASCSYVEAPVASNSYDANPTDDLRQSEIQTLPRPSTNGITDVMIESESCESRNSQIKDDLQFTVYNAYSGAKFPPCAKTSPKLEEENSLEHLDYLDINKSKSAVSLLMSMTKNAVEPFPNAGSQYDKHSSIRYKSRDEDTDIESSAALTTSQTHIAISFLTQVNPGSETTANQNENVVRNRPRSKIVANDFRLNPSFASRRSTVVMMATPISPREPQAQVSSSSHHSRHESSNSPTAFYYFLGPSLDEALVDVRVVFQNLIDKITGRGR